MVRYCKCCKQPRKHRKLKGFNVVQKVVGYSVMAFCGGIVPLGDVEYECNHCGNIAKDD